MDATLIVERGVYAQSADATYFRKVEMVVSSPSRPGRRVVLWSTDAFNVKDAGRRMRGRCGIDTFARWAKVRIN